MSLPKILILTTCLLFGLIGVLAFLKNQASHSVSSPIVLEKTDPIVAIEEPILEKSIAQAVFELDLKEQKIVKAAVKDIVSVAIKEPVVSKVETLPVIASVCEELPEVDRIAELFSTKGTTLPIVETVTYKSRVPWQQGRPAWLSDYAAHYQTSRHFIARSLNGVADYFKQDLCEGNRFNVLKLDKNIRFHLLIDVSKCKLWFYYTDLDTNEHVLLKTYPVSLGRPDNTKPSGSLTPLGKYSLGSKIAIYKPNLMGFHQGKKTEMIRIFGTRWIPFEEELEQTTASAKGFGIHGVPWIEDSNGVLVADDSSLGKYESDGCIRLKTSDIEEIFSIIITKPSIIELVKDLNSSSM